ncbi:MAG: anthranilate phosphoribosyltransferase [Anaerolineae bacterium]|nr:anthranilate phosphoribosyltransferase [Anaerolineae bacterium]
MTIDIQRAIDVISRFGQLRPNEAEAVMNQIMRGEATEAQIGAYLMGLRMKGETQSEILGSARAMRANVVVVPTSGNGTLLDTCGTGGDKSGTFNISTTVAFVAAGAGVQIAKHGNRASTSKCGSADVLAALGVNLDLTPEQVGQCVDEIGIGFLFAPKLHPAMKHAMGARRQLKVRTIFNLLGPLTNPAGAQRQLMGVFAPDLTEFIALVLRELGAEAAIVVCGYGNMDELTTTGPNQVSELANGEVRNYTLNPLELDLHPAHIWDLMGGELDENAAILRGVLSGEVNSAKRDVVLLNACAALLAAGVAEDYKDGIAQARDVIDSGKALEKLETLIAYTQELGNAG